MKEAKARSASADDQASLKAELQILETESADQKAKYHDLRQRLKQEQEYSSADSVNRSRQHMLELRELIENAARKGLLEAEPR